MKILTFRYGITQFTFWAASTGASSFATTYLLKSGLSSGVVGTLLAVAGVLSCIAQPLLAGVIDRSRRLRLPQILACMSFICTACFAVLLLLEMPALWIGLFYVSEIFLSNIMRSLLNALYVSCEQNGYSINFGIARGTGFAASAIASLVLGYVIAQFGNRWMLVLLVAFRLLNTIIFLGYPAIEKPEPPQKTVRTNRAKRSFFLQYPWYCATLLGILFLGMYHAMTENYMIAIMERLGGNSSHVGIAMFISCMSGAAVIFVFKRVKQRLSEPSLLKIAACSFLLKSVLICMAGSVRTVYLIQLLQMTSYAFLDPTQVYYAKNSVHPTDMVKGQAFSTAAYALGCSAGNFIGGQLLTRGVSAILVSGIFMALIGTVLIFCTATKKD